MMGPRALWEKLPYPKAVTSAGSVDNAVCKSAACVAVVRPSCDNAFVTLAGNPFTLSHPEAEKTPEDEEFECYGRK
jgi:hypothetical protein